MLSSTARLQQVQSGFLSKLAQIEVWFRDEKVTTSIQELRDLIHSEIDDEALTKRLHRLRVPLQDLLDDDRFADKHEAKVLLLNVLQLMTFISPINDLEDDSFVSIITRDKFPDQRIYYSTAGYMIHYRDMHSNPQQTVAMLAGRGLSPIEKDALGVYVFQQGLYPTSLLTNVLSSTTLKTSLQTALMLYLVVSYTQACHTDPNYLANINWLHAMTRMIGYPFEALHRTVWPIASLYSVSEGAISCVWNSFTNPRFMLEYYLGAKVIGHCHTKLAEYLSEHELHVETTVNIDNITTDLTLVNKIPQWLKLARYIEQLSEQEAMQRHHMEEAKFAMLRSLWPSNQ